MKQRELNLVDKVDFYKGNFSVEKNKILALANVNKPVQFILENEGAFRKLFAIENR